MEEDNINTKKKLKTGLVLGIISLAVILLVSVSFGLILFRLNQKSLDNASAIEKLENENKQLRLDVAEVEKRYESKKNELDEVSQDYYTKQEITGAFSYLLRVDTDEDGLSDYEEMFVYKTDPGVADTDNDGNSDSDEVNSGYNPNGDGTLETPENLLQSLLINIYKNNLEGSGDEPADIKEIATVEDWSYLCPRNAENIESACGFDVHILVRKDNDIKSDEVQEYYLELETKTEPKFYGPYRANLQDIIYQAKNI